MELSRRVSHLKPSATLALSQRVQAMKAAGKSIIDLTVGQPDFPTPERVCRAAKAAIDRGETKYTAVGGIRELKEAIARRLAKDYGRTYGPKQLVVSTGAKQALFNLCLAVLNEGDEVVLFSPYWTSYTEMAELAGGKPVVLASDERFHPDLPALKKAITTRTRLLVLNSPCNPTGAVYTRETLSEIARLVAAHPNLLVVTDDIYERFVFGESRFTSIGMLPEMPEEQLLIVNGPSKTYSMTGWRIGYLAGPQRILETVDALQSQSTSNASSISQWAALEALTGDQSDVEEMRRAFEKRRDLVLGGLTGIPGLKVVPPDGAFYVFPDARAFLGRSAGPRGAIRDDVALAEYFLEDAGVGIVPGSAFGAPGFFRLTYSASAEALQEGVRRIVDALARLR